MVSITSRFGTVTRRLRLRTVAVLASVALASAGVAATAAPSYADTGSSSCYNFATGSITAPTTAVFGSTIRVSWNVSSICLVGVLVFVNGPGSVNGPTSDFSGTFTTRAIPAGQSMTYTLTVLNMDSDFQESKTVATATVFVP